MDQQATTTKTTKEIMNSYGRYFADIDGTAHEVLHNGEWVRVSGSMSDTDTGVIILGVFTGQIEKVWDEYGEHIVPTFNCAGGGITTTIDAVHMVRE